MKKWAGVNVYIASHERQWTFTRVSTKHNTVRNSSGDAHWPNVAFKAVFTDCTRRSQYDSSKQDGLHSMMAICRMAACDDGTAHCNISIRSISRSQLKPLVVGQLINQALIFLRVPRDAYRFPQAAMPVPEDLFC
ncbi:hypothetical protein T03_4060 [Trichinella britovi]|uniref:Uncharacterized protein n=1 Tax=Trichinella britovi TaxID=45882 RepID=A0A0V1CCX3_TRIBR|nr:hypothetical protein T03_4060 [Trichinella britovi]